MGIPRTRSVPGIIFALLVLLFAFGNISAGFYPYGTAVWLRPLFSLLGIVGAIFLLSGITWWRIMLSAWCLLQTWVIATDVSGEWFSQGLWLGYKNSHSVSNNNVRVVHEASGLNFAGLILFAVLLLIILAQWHPVIRRPTTKLQRRAVLAVILLIGATVLFSVRRASASPGTFVINLDLPNVPIYYQDKLLGRTPLRITPDKIKEWNLPLSDNRLRVYSWGWADSLILSDGSKHLPLYAGAPWPFAGYLDTFDTPWGQRCRMHIGSDDDAGNQQGNLWRKAELRDEPVLIITLLNTGPVTAGGPLRVRCTLSNPTTRAYQGAGASLTRLCFSHIERENSNTLPGTKVRRKIALGEEWNQLPPNATMFADLEFDAPSKAGSYEFFCTWFLQATPDSAVGAGGCYSNMLNLQVVPK